MKIEEAVAIVRLMIGSGINPDVAIKNNAIPFDFRSRIKQILDQEKTIILEPVHLLQSERAQDDWLNKYDRSGWYYWLTLRSYLLGIKNRPEKIVRSIDENTDRILSQLKDPQTNQFDIRGLVLGYVQSGKTANYTALIAKAADIGYRFIIVLSGIDNGLRLQTQIRLNRELVGYADGRLIAVPIPPIGLRWHQFTSEDINGDFRPGLANNAALQGNQPVLLVIKKNGAVLRRLLAWINNAPEDVKRTLPLLMIDDEADQASIDTRGTYQVEGEVDPEEMEDPTAINRLVRSILTKFQKKAYVGYTATPFANILIPHDNYNPQFANDLYPRDFIVDLPKPNGYFGAEELFGRFDRDLGEEIGGLDIIRTIPDQELSKLDSQHEFPNTLELAIYDFILAGAARSLREDTDFPATMLLHGSQLVLKQFELAEMINQKFSELRDEWRYQRLNGILNRLRERWENDFTRITSIYNSGKVSTFSDVESKIGPFFEAVQIRTINSRTGEILNYDQEPYVKAIAIGGNRLSRGLTLEGLLTSYFFRPTTMYDTLMQMGRWFGFHQGYQDLMRIHMTSDLASWFSDLALVEHELRQDIRVYESLNVTPCELGVRILKHPAMLVTSRLKQRFARTITIEQSYSHQVLQTIRFPFQDASNLELLLDSNLKAVKNFLLKLNSPVWEDMMPLWNGVSSEILINFLNEYKVDSSARNISIPLIIDYIKRQNEDNELINWTVAIKGREKPDQILGQIDLGLERVIPMISRTRLVSDKTSLGVITNPGDELIGLTSEELEKANSLRFADSKPSSINPAARLARSFQKGLIIIYPVSRFSGYEKKAQRIFRQPIYDDPQDQKSTDILCFAISFSKSLNERVVRGEYALGTVDWRPV